MIDSPEELAVIPEGNMLTSPLGKEPRWEKDQPNLTATCT